MIMQTLEKRKITNTPADISQVGGNCGSVFKQSCDGRDSEQSLKTSSNNPDATLTSTRTGGAAQREIKVAAVYVLNMQGEPLMPCSPRKARVLLKAGKAVVVKRTPFSIQLNYSVGNVKQKASLGIDSGYKHVGLSVVSDESELFAAELQLRDDIVKLNSERRTYRKSRRERHHRYRPTRFLNRKKSEGWLAPSIQHKLDSHIKAVRFIAKFLPISEINIEVAAFDIQKIKNPYIEGVEYQQGEQYGFWNVREYVLFRDNHTCQHCNGKSKDPVLNVHHLRSRQVGGDRPDNLLTLCKTCHDDYHDGNIELKIKPSKGFVAEAFMSMVRWSIKNELKRLFPHIEVKHTYGHITKSNRIANKIAKSHVNDAFVIAGGTTQQRATEFLIKQVRKCNRKLFSGSRSERRNTAPRYVHGFQRFDKVRYSGVECFVFGRRLRGYFDLRLLDGSRIHRDANVRHIKLLESAITLLIDKKEI